jgi:hypothetical protein
VADAEAEDEEGAEYPRPFSPRTRHGLAYGLWVWAARIGRSRLRWWSYSISERETAGVDRQDKDEDEV